MSSQPDVKTTVGALLAGCFVSVALSAILGFQTFLYFQIFPSDRIRYKALVVWIWILDALHTVLICTALWEFTILNFGDVEQANRIFPTVAATVVVTGVTTVSANAFYGWRIHKLSKQNLWISGPIAFLSFCRISLSVVNAVEMHIYQTFSKFASKFKLLITAGLAVSAITDILVYGTRYYYLRNLQQGYLMTQEVVDGILVFTVNDGLLTCAVAIAAISCWLGMHNYIWLGIFFSLAKRIEVYSNSVLATLNLRNWYRHRPPNMSSGIPMKRTTVASDRHNGGHPGLTSDKQPRPSLGDDGMPARMEVFVDHQVEYNVDVGDLGRTEDEDAHSRSSRKSMTIA
ncbi:hypothetical protein DFH07DRAFT_966986 [Mycena maculata]|uniref:DUF6534 domain-containing protein n=1 Tax=Mycena maculata TaxID=230809 RepID=A0AAD7I7U7_9AGAR|nr:hypothetical protein DFH07DRAFT_966986 [Mycena maculata]